MQPQSQKKLIPPGGHSPFRGQATLLFDCRFISINDLQYFFQNWKRERKPAPDKPVQLFKGRFLKGQV
jgi:hypothetical protein